METPENLSDVHVAVTGDGLFRIFSKSYGEHIAKYWEGSASDFDTPQRDGLRKAAFQDARIFLLRIDIIDEAIANLLANEYINEQAKEPYEDEP